MSKLALIDAQGFIDGIGPMAKLPRPLAALGVSVLKTQGLRMAANKMAYRDKERYATQDAMRIGRLHTHLPGWLDANVAFMRSGGYAISGRISQVGRPGGWRGVAGGAACPAPAVLRGRGCRPTSAPPAACPRPQVQQPTLVLWGRQDEILEPSTAAKFEAALPNGRLVWVEECGHCAHLEQPAFAAEQIMAFVREGAAAGALAA